ncbi:MAG: topoisomerase IV, partial [Oscillospiraceae bacterium]|nr:topoisomerase IV [Oscillospiraceae bacterium]
FGIDEIQAEYVAEIKLRNINKEYILKRVQEEESLRDEIDDLEDLVASPNRIRKVIVGELENVKKKHAVPRRTTILYEHQTEANDEDDDTPDYAVSIFLSRGGYFKKITPQSLRMADVQKYKDDDALAQTFETTNKAEVMFFTDQQQVYKCRLSDFADTKASALGDYLPTKLGMDVQERVISMILPGDYSGALFFFFENGKAARVDLSSYATTSNRRKLTGAYSDKSPLVTMLHLKEEQELVLYSSEVRALVFNTALLTPKTTRTTIGVQLMTLKPKYHLSEVIPLEKSNITNLGRYRCRAIPAAGALLNEEDSDQMKLL